MINKFVKTPDNLDDLFTLPGVTCIEEVTIGFHYKPQLRVVFKDAQAACDSLEQFHLGTSKFLVIFDWDNFVDCEDGQVAVIVDCPSIKYLMKVIKLKAFL